MNARTSPRPFRVTSMTRLGRRSSSSSPPQYHPHSGGPVSDSSLIQLGESLAYVEDQLGRHSILVTVDRYGHLVSGANRNPVGRLAAATGSNNPRERARGGP